MCNEGDYFFFWLIQFILDKYFIKLSVKQGYIKYHFFSLWDTQFSFIWTIDRTLSGATTPGQNGPGINGNERVLRIPQSSSIAGTLPSDCLVSYLGYWLEGVLLLYWVAVFIFCCSSRLVLNFSENEDFAGKALLLEEIFSLFFCLR